MLLASALKNTTLRVLCSEFKLASCVFECDWILCPCEYKSQVLSVGGMIKSLKSTGVKPPKGKDIWSKRAVESTLTRQKYTGDEAIAVSGNASCQYLNTDCHTGIISKETFEAVEL